MRMLTDNAIRTRSEDRFGFARYAGLLVDIVRDTTDLPFCIGIFGAWGTGKTSLMNMIRDDLSNEPDVRTIWFNPWKYDRKEDLWHALIQTILFQIAEASDGRGETAQRARELAKSTIWLALKKGLTTLSSGLIKGKDLDTLKDTLFKQDELHYRHVNTFEKDFQSVVEMYTGQGKLVVLIDDLDRCLPENAITVLESLKLFIGHARCVFVLGMDHLVVEQGLEARFGERLRISGRDYLDKIVQVPFYLPPVPFLNIREALAVTKTADYDESIWRLVEAGLGGNPRKTKRFVNSFYLLRNVLRDPAAPQLDGQYDILDVPSATPDQQQFYLAKLLILQLGFPAFYRRLASHPGSWQVYEDELLQADSAAGREPILADHAGLSVFWEHEPLRTFMRTTARSAGSMFPPPPPGAVVASLIGAVRLVTSESRYEEMRSAGAAEQKMTES